MRTLLSGAHLVDVVFVFMALEMALLIIVRRKTRRGPRPMDLFVSLLGGAALLGALRAALTGHAWPWVAVFLVLSLLAHAWDLSRRGRGQNYN